MMSASPANSNKMPLIFLPLARMSFGHLRVMTFVSLPPRGGGSESLDLRSKSLAFAGGGVSHPDPTPSPAETKGLLTQTQVSASSPSRGEELFCKHSLTTSRTASAAT